MYRILLVDDDQNIVDGLGSIIKQNFENIFIIYRACDVSDALKRLTEGYYHLIISDIRMPKLGWHQSSGADQQKPDSQCGDHAQRL